MKPILGRLLGKQRAETMPAARATTGSHHSGKPPGIFMKKLTNRSLLTLLGVLLGASSALAAAATHLVITGSATQTAGEGQNLTITAKDDANVTDTTYGNQDLIFSGSGTAPDGTHYPTVINSGGAWAGPFGDSTSIFFTAGVATVNFTYAPGGDNGVMTLYLAGSTTINVTDGTINSSSSWHWPGGDGRSGSAESVGDESVDDRLGNGGIGCQRQLRQHHGEGCLRQHLQQRSQ